MKLHRIGLTVCTLTLMAWGAVAVAETSGVESKTQKSTKASTESSKKKRNQVCMECGKAEKECKCEGKKHDEHEKGHDGHSH